MIDYGPLYQQLGYTFKDADLLELALTHSSRERHANYERLEFLGDRILGFLVADLLYKTFPQDSEGSMSRRIVKLVCQPALAEIAREMGLPDYILLSKGEEKAGGNQKDSMLADCCESVLAAVYLDGGIEVATALINRFWTQYLHKDMAAMRDARSLLQELVQSQGKPLPHYNVIEVFGEGHAPTFRIEVQCEGYPAVMGEGSNKKAAMQDAARQMLIIIQTKGK